MIPKKLFEMISSIQEYRSLKSKPSRYLAYVIEKIVTSTIPELYVREFMKYNNFGRYITISFDCDLHEDVMAYEELLAFLDRYDIKASFAVVGKLIEMHPDEHKLLLEAGHEIVNHTYTHPNSRFNRKKFNELNYEEQKQEIKKFDEVCQEVLGYKPIGFRTPHFSGLHTPTVYKILNELGYKYSSSTVATRTRGFGMPYSVNGIMEIPLTPCPKYPFSCLETWGLYRAPIKKYKNEKEFFRLFKKLVDLGKIYNSYLNFYFDPVDVVKMSCFEDMLSLITTKFEVLTYKEFIKIYSKKCR